MKILEIAGAWKGAMGYGVGRHVRGLARALTSAGHEVHLLTASLEARPLAEEDGVRLHAFEFDYPFHAYCDHLQAVFENLGGAERLVRLFEEQGPFDLVHVHDWSGALLVSSAARLFPFRWIATLHGTEVGRRGGRLAAESAYIAEIERWMCAEADGVVAPSDFVKSELGRAYGIPANRILVLAGGIDAGPFRIEVDGEEFRQMFAPPEAPLVLFAGRLQHAKGPDLLLQAVPEILRARPETRFVVVGHGELEEQLAEEVQKKRLEGAVRLTGMLGEAVLGALYRVSDLLVLPSRYEAFGISALEAILHDLPVVATPCGGTSEIARAVGRRMTPSEGSPAALAKTILHCIEDGRAKERDPIPREERIPVEWRWSSVARAFESVFGATVGVSG